MHHFELLKNIRLILYTLNHISQFSRRRQQFPVRVSPISMLLVGLTTPSPESVQETEYSPVQ